LRSNIDSKLSKVFKAGVNLSLSRTVTEDNGPNFISLIREDPFKPPFDEDGNFTNENFGVSNQTDNLLANAELNQNDIFRDRILINTYVQASLGKKVVVKSTFGGDFLFGKTNNFVPSTNPSRIRTNRLGSANVTRFDDADFLNENTINYNDTFGNHSLSLLGGVTFQTSSRETVIVGANEIPSDGVGVNAIELAPLEETSINSNYSEFSFFSLLARLNYSYKDKYLLTATIRRDGSSRLGENNRFGVFPSAGFAWKMSEEPFLKDVDAIDNLKLRLSYGVTGNSGVNPFSTLSTFGTQGTAAILDGIPVAGVVQGTLASPDLKWETTTQYDAAIEFSLFNKRLSGEIDVYYKKTDDLLLAAEVPSITGFGTTIQNVGSLENRGIDVTLTGVLIDTEDFNWTTSLTVSSFKNEVLDLGNKTFIETSRLGAPANDPNSQLVVGQPVGIFWGFQYESIDPATGDAIFTDISGPDGVPDGSIDAEHDAGVIGSANPDIYGGIQMDFSYKNFDMAAFFPYSIGNENYNEEIFLAGETQINSFASIRDNIWSASNTENASFPRVGSTSFNVSNSFYVQDASYLRLSTLQLGYTLPKDIIKGVNKLRFYFTGTNLFTVKSDEYLGYDPDVSSNGDSNTLRGFDNLAYPQNRSLLLGIDITF